MKEPKRINLNHHAILLDVVPWRSFDDDYLAISAFNILSYVVVVDAWLGEGGGSRTYCSEPLLKLFFKGPNQPSDLAKQKTPA